MLYAVMMKYHGAKRLTKGEFAVKFNPAGASYSGDDLHNDLFGKFINFGSLPSDTSDVDG